MSSKSSSLSFSPSDDELFKEDIHNLRNSPRQSVITEVFAKKKVYFLYLSLQHFCRGDLTIFINNFKEI